MSPSSRAVPTLHYITQVNFEFGALRTLRAECGRVGLRRALIVGDSGIVPSALLDHRHVTRPRLATRDECLAILEASS